MSKLDLQPESSESSGCRPCGLLDAERLRLLAESGLLDSPPEERFDRFTRMADNILKAPVSLVSLVDGDRQFFKSHQGLGQPWAERRETPLSHSFCQHVVTSGAPLIIEDAREVDLVKHNLAIPELNVIAYAGYPLEVDGWVLGSFCAIHGQPHCWSNWELGLLSDLAASVSTEIQLRLEAASHQHTSELLRQALGRAEVTMKQLIEVEKLKENLTHMLVHDLKTPLTAILGYVRIVKEMCAERLEDNERGYLNKAVSNGDRLMKMLGSVLDLAKLESGEVQIEKTRVSVADLFDEVMLATEGLCRGQVTLEKECPFGLNAVFDLELIRRVLLNLADNAVRHLPEEEGLLRLRVARQEGELRFEVQDNGPGIPEESRGLIFEKFGQLNPGTKHTWGLGLSFCRMAVEAHGGIIGVEARQGGGSVFWFTLPQPT